jgi:hypothetical protein
MSHDQRFRWTEPFAFAQARARSTAGGNKVVFVLVLASLFAVTFVMTGSPSSAREFAVVALVSVTLTLLLAYPGTWLFSRIPKSIVVAADRIAVDGKVTPIQQVQSAIIGTTWIQGVEHRVLSFRTKDGLEYLYGIGHKINYEQLAEFLHQAGIREPQA